MMATTLPIPRSSAAIALPSKRRRSPFSIRRILSSTIPTRSRKRDFDGWIQERGLYFMDQWDSHYTPLLASNDPGEQPQKGGLLLAQYGKGYYIYTGYAFFRQLPFGVPGAIRLYVNLLSVGHEPRVVRRRQRTTASWFAASGWRRPPR